MLNVLFDNKIDRAHRLSEATRCLVKDFLIQYIILQTKALADFDAVEYAKALVALDFTSANTSSADGHL